MLHDDSVSRSFGPNASAYLTSAVHAQGADLERLAKMIAQTESARVLDLGCGAGHASFAAASVAREVVAYDLTESMLRVVDGAAKDRGLANIRTQQGSAEELPFAEGSFDWVVSRYSAHHWSDVQRALHEVKRVLKPGGHVCCIDVAGGPAPLLDTHLQAVELLRDASHVRNYTKKEWFAFFAGASLNATVEQQWRLPLEFASWVKRIGTPADRVSAIRALWAAAPAEVREYYAVKDDLSFELDVVMIVGR